MPFSRSPFPLRTNEQKTEAISVVELPRTAPYRTAFAKYTLCELAKHLVTEENVKEHKQKQSKRPRCGWVGGK